MVCRMTGGRARSGGAVWFPERGIHTKAKDNEADGAQLSGLPAPVGKNAGYYPEDGEDDG
jgi:hypothetical protein